MPGAGVYDWCENGAIFSNSICYVKSITCNTTFLMCMYNLQNGNERATSSIHLYGLTASMRRSGSTLLPRSAR